MFGPQAKPSCYTRLPLWRPMQVENEEKLVRTGSPDIFPGGPFILFTRDLRPSREGWVRSGKPRGEPGCGQALPSSEAEGRGWGWGAPYGRRPGWAPGHGPGGTESGDLLSDSPSWLVGTCLKKPKVPPTGHWLGSTGKSPESLGMNDRGPAEVAHAGQPCLVLRLLPAPPSMVS